MDRIEPQNAGCTMKLERKAFGGKLIHKREAGVPSAFQLWVDGAGDSWESARIITCKTHK